MSKSLTAGEAVILGLLAEESRHGYDLEQIIKARGIRDWTSLGFSSIYYLLEKLEKRDLIRRKSGAGARKVYEISDEGLATCRTTLIEMLADIRMGNSFLVALSNSPLLDDAVIVQALKDRKRRIVDRIHVVTANQQNQQPLPDFVDSVFDYSISLLQAERMWLEKTVAKMIVMEKVDLKKQLKELYNPKGKEFNFVDVPPMYYLMVSGKGNPNTAQSYKEAVEALYGVAYAIKFASKKVGKDYSVMPLEGLWYADNPEVFTARSKDEWQWTMMIMQPDWITEQMAHQAIETVRLKKQPAAIDLVRFERYDEGRSVQIMHVGSYDDETPKLRHLHEEFMPRHGLTFNGAHHEIYLGDPRKADPSKLKTVLRQPVKSNK